MTTYGMPGRIAEGSSPLLENIEGIPPVVTSLKTVEGGAFLFQRVNRKVAFSEQGRQASHALA